MSRSSEVVDVVGVVATRAAGTLWAISLVVVGGVGGLLQIISHKSLESFGLSRSLAANPLVQSYLP